MVFALHTSHNMAVMIQIFNLDPLVLNRNALLTMGRSGSGAWTESMCLSEFETVTTGNPNANDTTADPQAAPAKSQTLKVTAP
ncbi:hypothetical protein GCM10008927_23450 [Amylibacter ulvae]|uniref:Uncharacterized protein n=1 Tax=Paramylibacter ulvae TaxID=1651968 RepID=A0ABQ3D512_9RHOB|nr:hypothetical protein [Amylibacter ulvae]GHA57092.1 hypothetical protein GCM10008927_23450 [Amylibacter ulvae]